MVSFTKKAEQRVLWEKKCCCSFTAMSLSRNTYVHLKLFMHLDAPYGKLKNMMGMANRICTVVKITARMCLTRIVQFEGCLYIYLTLILPSGGGKQVMKNGSWIEDTSP